MLMGFAVDQASGARDGDVIRRVLIESDGQELPQRERIGETPCNAALTIEPFVFRLSWKWRGRASVKITGENA